MGHVEIGTGVPSTKSQARGHVFAILISEKGGAERREPFDQAEVNIGRVQGNELMLPKGNVSKRHARLVFRDGRFIVTDMNSTNGTYVNRRRISQATIVRQGDRIYIGDFVLRIEAQQEEEGSGLSSARVSVQPIPLREPMMTTPDDSGRTKSLPAAAPSSGYPPVPPAPRLPTQARIDLTPTHGTSSGPPRGADVSVVADRSPSVREDSISADTTLYRSAVAALVSRVGDKVGASVLDAEMSSSAEGRIGQAIDTELAALRQEETIGAAIAEERLKQDARAELIGIGPLSALLDDDAVASITVVGTSSIHAVRSGRRIAVEPPFSSEVSLRRVLARLSARSGVPRAADELVVSRRLGSNILLSAVTGARAPTGTLVHIERTQRIDTTLDDLVRAGSVSRAMATFFKQCALARANVLVVGAHDARPAAVAAALVAAGKDGHVVALKGADVIVSSAVSVSHLDVAAPPEEIAAMVELVGRLPDARIVVDPISGAVGALVMDAVAAGASGLVAVHGAATLRRGVSRLPADLAGARAGLPLEVAREWVAGTFDLFVEVARLRDGRQRVVRVAEASGVQDGEVVLRDVFSFVAERTATGGSVEGTFQPSGHTPRIVGDMAVRGIHVDSGVFSRPPSR